MILAHSITTLAWPLSLSPPRWFVADAIVRIWDIATGRQGGVCSIAFIPDGKVLISGLLDRILKLWDESASTTRKDSNALGEGRPAHDNFHGMQGTSRLLTLGVTR